MSGVLSTRVRRVDNCTRMVIPCITVVCFLFEKPLFEFFTLYTIEHRYRYMARWFHTDTAVGVSGNSAAFSLRYSSIPFTLPRFECTYVFSRMLAPLLISAGVISEVFSKWTFAREAEFFVGSMSIEDVETSDCYMRFFNGMELDVTMEFYVNHCQTR